MPSTCPHVDAPDLTSGLVDFTVFWNSTPSGDMDVEHTLFVQRATSAGGPWETIASGLVADGPLNGDYLSPLGVFLRSFSTVNADGTGCASDLATSEAVT